MRYDAAHKDQTRRRVLAEAAAAIRASGPDRIGIAAIMAKAGLTHGGFYAHFASKDDLVAQAVTQMFDESFERMMLRTQDLAPAVALTKIVDRYLDARHRDAPDQGCPMPSLSGELARMPAEARQRFSDGAARVTEVIASRLRELGRPHPAALANSVVAEMVGALSLSRAIADPEASTRILRDSRTAIRIRLGLEANR